MTSSGTSAFNLSGADCILESFDQIELRPPGITGEHMISAKRSLNLELQSWSNDVPQLWKMELVTIPLQQGIATYSLPTNVEAMLDTYLRTYQLSNTFNVTPTFSTTVGSRTVVANISNNGLQPGFWINITTPMAVGGLLITGFYQVVNVLSVTSFTFEAASFASSTDSSPELPLFSTQSGSGYIGVALTNHGMVTGQLFNVAAATDVGGVQLYGQYTVTSVPSANAFVISTAALPSFADSQYENFGLAQVLGQPVGADPIDRILEPMGRTDYVMMPDKFLQGLPTLYWFNRQINPTVTLWIVPDNNGPYLLSMWCMVRIQDANAAMGETLDIPYRALDALCSRLAARLAVKYAKNMLPVLQPLADKAWELFITEDRERAENFILPMVGLYYQGL